MQFSTNAPGCRAEFDLPPCPPPCPPDPESTNPSKYFQEIGAEMIGNRLTIRLEKDKDKSKKKRDHWDPPCDCEMVEIKRPTKKEGPKIVNGGDNNQILFKINSKDQMNQKEDPNYKPQAIAYKVGTCRGGQQTNDHCRTITVYPQLGGPGSQEVHSDHITEGCQDIFLLRIKKKGDTAEQKKRNIELELRTPKPPTPPPPPPPSPPTPPPVAPAASTSTVGKKKAKGGKGKGKKK